MKKNWLLLPVLLTTLVGCSSTTLLVAGGAAVLYYAKDGVVWRTETERMSEDKYRITVQKNTLPYGSGDGQAEQIFRRRAEEIAIEDGCKGYTTLEYTTSLDSTSLINQRVYEGIIQCRKEHPA